MCEFLYLQLLVKIRVWSLDTSKPRHQGVQEHQVGWRHSPWKFGSLRRRMAVVHDLLRVQIFQISSGCENPTVHRHVRLVKNKSNLCQPKSGFAHKNAHKNAKRFLCPVLPFPNLHDWCAKKTQTCPLQRSWCDTCTFSQDQPSNHTGHYCIHIRSIPSYIYIIYI